MSPARVFAIPLASFVLTSGMAMAQGERFSLPKYPGMTATIDHCAGTLPVSVVALQRSDLADGAAVRKVMAWAQLMAQTQCPQASVIELVATVDGKEIYKGTAHKADGWLLTKVDTDKKVQANVSAAAPPKVTTVAKNVVSDSSSGLHLTYRCVDKNGVATTFPVTEHNEYYLTAVIRTLGMRSVEEYEASGLDCRLPWEWANNVVPLGTAPLKPGYRAYDEPQPTPPAKPGPFTRFAMGDYLDAIYNGDFDRLKILDKEYLGKQIEQFQAGMNSYGPIGKMLTGVMQLDSASLVNPAIRAYSSSYGDTYNRCLGKDAVVFTATSTDTSTGITVSGASYSMNPEFSRAFQETYSAPSLGDMTEPLVNIANGVHQIMAHYACNDPVIKQFESQILDMYSKMKTR
jgi:hypothetical protein